MNQLIDIHAFCGKEDSRKYINTPCSLGEYSYATTGHFAIRIPVRSGFDVAEEKIGEALAGKFSGVETRSFGPMPDLEWPDKAACWTCGGGGLAEKTTCDECDGEGYVELENNHHTYSDIECKSCDSNGYQTFRSTDKKCPDCQGEGKVFNRVFAAQRFEGLGVTVDLIKLKRFLDLPGLEVASDPEKNDMFFKFDGGYGLLLGCKD